MNKLFIWLLCVILLAGCAPVPPTPTTEPTTIPTTVPTMASTTEPTTAPTEPSQHTEPTTAKDPNSLDDDQIEMLEQVFSTLDYLTRFPTNWYLMALCQEYDSPEEISISKLFNSGIGMYRDESKLTDSEKQYLSQFSRFQSHMNDGITIYRIARADVEEIVGFYFGLDPSLIKIDNPDRMVYWEETDCYYVARDGFLGNATVEIYSAVFQEDGTIRFEYTFSHILEPYLGGEAVIRPQYGGFQMISHRIITEPPA